VTLGLRFQEFPPSSVLSELGIREFDVLKSINGIKLKNVSTLSRLFTELRNTNKFELEIERYGQPLTLRYTLK
jgi:type II secretory pathway component PulC